MSFRFVVTDIDANLRPFQDKIRDAVQELKKFNEFVRQSREAGIKLTTKEERELAAEQIRLRKEIEKAESDLFTTRTRLERQAASETKKNDRDRAASAKQTKKDIEKADQDLAEERARILRETANNVKKEEQARVEATRQAEKEVERLFSESKRRITESLRSVANEAVKADQKASLFARNLERGLDSLGKNQLKTLSQQLGRVGNQLKFFAGVTIAGGVGGALKFAIDVSREYQQQEQTLATVLALTTKIVDAQGKEVPIGVAVTKNFEDARKTIKLIREEAAKTILEAPELITAFSKASGLARAGGIQKDEDILKIVSPAQQILKEFGLGQETQVASELRALFTGKELERSTLSQVLGIKKEDIDRATKAGKLFEFLNAKLKEAKPIITEAEHKFDALFSTLITKGQDFARQAFEKTFQKITGKIGDLNKFLSDEKITKFAEKFSTKLVEGFNALEDFFRSDTFKNIKSFFEFLVNHAEALLKIFLAMKALQGAMALGGLLGSLGSAGGLLSGTAAGATATLVGGAALPATVATLGGVGIGTAIRKGIPGVSAAPGFENTKDQQVLRQAATTDEETRQIKSRVSEDNTRRTQALLVAKERVRRQQARALELQGELHDLRQSVKPGSIEDRAFNQKSRQLVAQRERVDDAVRLLKETNESILKEQKDAAAKETAIAKARQEGLRRVSRGAAKKELEDRRAANKDRVETAIEVAQREGDKVREIKANAQKDILKVEEDRRKGDITSDANARKQIVAIQKGAEKEVLTFRREQEFETRQLEAEATGNEFAQIRVRAEARIADIKANVKDEKVRARQVAAVVADFERERKERTKALIDGARELNTKIVDNEKDAAQQRKRILTDLTENQKRRERELREQSNLRLEAERRFARESRRLAKETKDAQQDLTDAVERQRHAFEDLAASQASRGIQKSARGLVNEFFNTDTFQGRQLGKEITGLLTSGDAQGATELAAQHGVEGQSLGVFAGRAQDIADRATALEDRQNKLKDQRDIENEQKSIRDAGEAVGQAQDRIKEAQQREIEARDAFNKSLTEINLRTKEIEEQFKTRRQELLAQFDGVARNFERSLINMRQEAEKLVKTFQDLGGAVSSLPLPLQKLATKRAGGGPGLPGRPYWVGEQGPELFIPRAAGDITSHDKAMQAFPSLAGNPFAAAEQRAREASSSLDFAASERRARESFPASFMNSGLPRGGAGAAGPEFSPALNPKSFESFNTRAGGFGGALPAAATPAATGPGSGINITINVDGKGGVTGDVPPNLKDLFEEFGRKLERELRTIPTR